MVQDSDHFSSGPFFSYLVSEALHNTGHS